MMFGRGNTHALSLRAARKLAGLTQTEAAEALSKTKSAISAYETGQNVPDARVLYDLSRLYGVSVDFFFGGAR